LTDCRKLMSSYSFNNKEMSVLQSILIVRSNTNETVSFVPIQIVEGAMIFGQKTIATAEVRFIRVVMHFAMK
jgi:hypothetical protein